MKKRNVVSVAIVILICASYLGSYGFYLINQGTTFNYLAPDVVLVANSKGLSLAQKTEIEQVDGIKEVEYFSSQLSDFKRIGNKDNEVIWFDTLNIPISIIDYLQIELVAGSELAANNQLLVCETLAKLLVDYHFIDSSVVGQKLKLDKVYTIVGVYPDPKLLRVEESVDTITKTPSSKPLQNISVTNGGAIGVEYSPTLVDSAIANYNISVANTKANMANEQVANALAQDVDQLNDDYDALTTLGVTGLIDPATDYGQQFDQFALLKLDDAANQKQVVSDLDALQQDSVVITSKSKFYKYEQASLKLGLVGLLSVLIVLVYSFPQVIKKK